MDGGEINWWNEKKWEETGEPR